MKIKELCDFLEEWAPGAYQESYDNSGLLVGDQNREIEGVLVSLDCTEEVVDEAISKGCNIIVSHHPVVFGGLKRLTGKNYVERTVIKAIENRIALFAIHTNLDNVPTGVNKKIADKLGLINTSILAPKAGKLSQLVTYVPEANAEELRVALANAGAGKLGNYSDCGFQSKGEGTFKPLDGSQPYLGEINSLHREKETRLEMIFPSYLIGKMESVLKKVHPYEEVAYSILGLENKNNYLGSGMIGELEIPMPLSSFLPFLKNKMEIGCVRYTNDTGKNIQKVALCGGSGSFLLKNALAANADIFITGDFKYHEFFDAENNIIIADIGHFESEHYTIELIVERIQEKFRNFAICKSTHNTNPINYY